MGRNINIDVDKIIEMYLTDKLDGPIRAIEEWEDLIVEQITGEDVENYIKLLGEGGYSEEYIQEVIEIIKEDKKYKLV